MNINDWKSQLRRGTIEYSILILLTQKECYGYEIIKILSEHSGLAVTENTIYPLLRRLEKDDHLTSKWMQNSENTPPRKYYAVTKLGEKYLSAMNDEWDSMVNSIEKIKKGEING
ncbi:MAG: PadR family transcriptional regulator [Clostridiales bacterium]|nr:MAG: PadR family transcriptional regulator [Clostridiales bacterium]